MIITANQQQQDIRSQDEIFIFGYGSLVWKPDFESNNKFIAYLPGYERRFWQSSVHHRGTKAKPGRCLTLVPADGSKCWGLVYQVTGNENVKKVYDYLFMREQSIGCYDLKVLPVVPKDKKINNGKPIMALVYYATPKNPHYVEESEEKSAKCIATSHGLAGHSIEYLFRVTDFMTEHLPNEEEPHLYNVDRMVRKKIGLSQTHLQPWNILTQCDRFNEIIRGERLHYNFDEDVIRNTISLPA
eukprot:TCONS_00031967-protein